MPAYKIPTNPTNDGRINRFRISNGKAQIRRIISLLPVMTSRLESNVSGVYVSRIRYSMPDSNVAS